MKERTNMSPEEKELDERLSQIISDEFKSFDDYLGCDGGANSLKPEEVFDAGFIAGYREATQDAIDKTYADFCRRLGEPN